MEHQAELIDDDPRREVERDLASQFREAVAIHGDLLPGGVACRLLKVSGPVLSVWADRGKVTRVKIATVAFYPLAEIEAIAAIRAQGRTLPPVESLLVA